MMANIQNEFLEQVLEDGYKILTSSKNHWPKWFTKEQKEKLINKQILFWEKKQDFVKCAKLQRVLKQLGRA